MELLNFFKTISILITTLATGLSVSLMEPNPQYPIQPSIAAEQYLPEEFPSQMLTPAPERNINVESIIGILCNFLNVNPDSENFGERKYQRGSGVIINKDGFILTNRDVVDPSFYDFDSWADYQLEGCLAGPAPKNYRVPTEEEIKSINPFVQVPVLTYLVEPVFAPYEADISDYENDWLDFSLLLITDLNPDAKYFGVNSLPQEFPYTPILLSEVPSINDKVISFGYPKGTTLGFRGSVSTIFIQGLLSHITGLWTGDQRFKEELFLLQSGLDSEGTAEGGRFGSPIFWKGYIIGIHIYKQEQSLNTYNLGIQPIIDILESNGISMFDEVY